MAARHAGKSASPSAQSEPMLAWMIVVACLLVFSALALTLVADTGLGEVDVRLSNTLHIDTNHMLASCCEAVTILGSEVVITLGVGFGLMLAWGRAWPELGVWAGALLGSRLLNVLLKTLFERPRPALSDLAVVETSYSFPSGHAMSSLVMYGLLAYWLSARVPSRAGRWALGGAMALLVLAIGASRVILGVHYASDVLGGFAAGGAWLVLWVTMLNQVRARRCSEEVQQDAQRASNQA